MWERRESNLPVVVDPAPPCRCEAACRAHPAKHSAAERARWRHYIFPLAGLLALIWFLVRVVPKPARAAYPCQQVARPLAGGFLVWLVAVAGAFAAYRRARMLYHRNSLTVAAVLMGAAIAGLIAIGHGPLAPVAAADPPVPNDPIGVPRGIYPGRVVWVHNPNATDWAGTNYAGDDIGDGYWWQSSHTDQAVVDEMLSRAVRGVAGAATDGAAWDAIFRHFNQNHGHGDIGYQPGERITIKVNLVTANRIFASFFDADGNQTGRLGRVNTSPQMILALLRQLVYVVGVAQSDITVGDTTTFFPNHYWNHCHPEFPDVHYLAWTGAWGRDEAQTSQGTAWETPVYWSTSAAQGALQDYLPLCYAQAAYLIDFACLKGHSSGVTLCAKNHYGSLIRLPDEPGYYNLHLSLPNPAWSPGTGHYRALVDLVGHAQLGGKILISFIDGLYGGYWAEGWPHKWLLPPFGSGTTADWPSSLFASLDAVALDSVAYDFLLAEWPNVVTGGTGAPGSLQGGQEDYLHEAALANNPPSGTFYNPDGAGVGLSSLGVHEHWNDATHKQYSRNLGTGDGIELIHIAAHHIGDLNCDGVVGFGDINPFVLYLSNFATWQATYVDCLATNGDINGDGVFPSFADINPFVMLLSGG